MTDNLKLVGRTIWNQVASLFFVLLVVSAIVSFYVGEYSDGVVISVIIFVNFILGFIQEFRASKAGEELLHLVEPKVYVSREDKIILIKTSELVLGDMVHLTAGSISPADVEVLESKNAFLDESVRTGETLSKIIDEGMKILAGSTVTSGKVVAKVVALGRESSLEKYRSNLDNVKKWNSFNAFTERVIKYIFIISMSVLLLSMFFFVFVLQKYALSQFFIFAIAMLVGVVPEMLPLIITIILTRESLKLASNKVIVKRLASLESLGAVQFLLTDKTGTITENKLKVSAVIDNNNFWQISNSITEGEYERSLLDVAYDDALNTSIGKIKTTILKITNYTPFDRNLGYQTFILEGGIKVARGITANIFALCKNHKNELLEQAYEYEKRGMRVISLATSQANEWVFCGFSAYYDPIKSSVTESLKIAHDRGIFVKIITGDSEVVARFVANELGLIHNPKNIISLENIKIESLTEGDLRQAIVFAKCTPEDKLALMDRYLGLGPVAFLGDGINDALALKRADIGVAVENASDIAKESADIILLEKDLSPILKSISSGRKALRNILVYIMYTLSGNAGTFLSLLVASFFYPVFPMLPIQILLNNLLTDLPLMLLITDNPDEYAISHVPHFKIKKVMQRVLLFGLVSSFFDLIYFQIYRGISVAEFQTGWFIFSVLAELALILSIRSSRPIWKSPALSMPFAIGIFISAILPFVFINNHYFAQVFKFTPLSQAMLGVIFGITIIYIVVNELLKHFMRKRNLYNKPLPKTVIFR